MQTNPIPAGLDDDPAAVLALADAAIEAPDAELLDLQVNLLYLQRVQAALRLRASLIEDEDLCGQLEALLVDSIAPAVNQLSGLVASLAKNTSRSAAARRRRRDALAKVSG